MAPVKTEDRSDLIYSPARDVVSPSRKEGYGGYEMPKRYVLRWERNWVIECESSKEEQWLLVAEIGNVLEKILIDFGKLFQKIGAVWLYERLNILREEVKWWSIVKWLEERV